MDYNAVKKLCIDNRQVEALEGCDLLLKRNPSDESVILMKSSILRFCRDCDSSLKLLFDSSFNRLEKAKEIEVLYNYVFMEDYDKALDKVMSIAKTYKLDQKDLKKIKEIHMSILGLTNPSLLHKMYPRKYADNYNQEQLLYYSEEEAYRFIKGKKKFTEFAYGFNIIDEFTKIQENMSNYERFPNLYHDTYYVPYKECGMNHGKNCDVIQVDTIKKTKQIVRMFPIPEYETMEYARKDYLKRYKNK